MQTRAPLTGLKVVELARVLAGPWAGQTLADLGAEVIKVEAPGGDDTRRWGPPFIERPLPGGGSETVAAYFQTANRGKRSVTCDFRDPEQLAQVKALIQDADVLIENFKVDGLKKFGLDYESLAPSNPRLVYASITGFGQDGPRAHEPGYDFLLQAMCGMMDLTGEPGGDPQKIGVPLVDLFAGVYAVIGIQAALAERAVSGEGQHVDVSLMECGAATLANLAMNYMVSGQEPRRIGSGHPNIVPYQTFPAADGHLVITCGNDGQFAHLCAVLDSPDLPTDPDFATNGARVRHRDRLYPILEAATAQRTRADLIAALAAAGVPAGPINTVSEALADPQIAARGLRVDPERIPGLRTPITFSRSALTTDKAAPLLGRGTWGFGYSRIFIK